MSGQVAELSDAVARFTQGIPRNALAVDLASCEGRHVLTYGAAAERLVARLDANGAKVVSASNITECVRLLAGELFDVLVVDPQAVNGIELVKAVKMAVALTGVSEEQRRRAAQQHRYMPVILLPFPDEDEYAVLIKPPDIAFLESVTRVPLVNVILCLDVRRLLDDLPPVA